MLGLEELLERRPGALSGGQRQRVAMGRAIVREPAAFLMDEPLSNLDAKLRVDMRAELARLHERLGVTTVYVTHDQVEAMTLGQRVAVMRDGHIQQVDTPQTLYRSPANLFVAAFIGSPSMNLVEATVEDGHASFAGFRDPAPAGRRPARAGERDPRHPPAGLRGRGVRRPVAADDRGRASTVVEELGSETHVIFPIDAAPVDAAAVLAATDERASGRCCSPTTARSLFTAEVDEARRCGRAER